MVARQIKSKRKVKLGGIAMSGTSYTPSSFFPFLFFGWGAREGTAGCYIVCGLHLYIDDGGLACVLKSKLRFETKLLFIFMFKISKIG